MLQTVFMVSIVSGLMIAALFTLNILNLAFFLSIQTNYVATLSRKPPRPRQAPARRADQPFISVHVPCYDEPAELLIETLSSLATLDYDNYEVLVLDNNTPDPLSFAPVERACAALGPRFRFYHFDGVVGAKAGALNIGLTLCAPQARYVAVVDADYQVTPDFLSRAADALSGDDVAFVQFPQAYRGVAGVSTYVETELSDYFRAFAPHADSQSSMLLTGTLSVIDIDTLKAVGGWSVSSVTEDAELGVRFFENGHHGVYEPTIVGRGLLPMSYAALKSQRRRWAIGNLQTLTAMLRRGRLGVQLVGFSTLVAQLTAWPAFWLVPILTLGLIALGFPSGESAATVGDLAAATILIMFGCGVGRFLADRSLGSSRLRDALLVFVAKHSLAWTSSTAFFPVLLGRPVGFARTPKLAGALKRLSLDASAAMGLFGLWGAAIYAARGDWLAALACVIVAAIAPSALWVDRGLRRYAVAASERRTADIRTGR